MTFNYMCTRVSCVLKNKKVEIKKCPCSVFTKEYCEQCNYTLARYKEDTKKIQGN